MYNEILEKDCLVCMTLKYNDRLRICKLETLELRRLHTDLIMVYKIVNNLMIINLNGSVKTI